jgi:hypothetical protein
LQSAPAQRFLNVFERVCLSRNQFWQGQCGARVLNRQVLTLVIGMNDRTSTFKSANIGKSGIQRRRKNDSNTPQAREQR